MLSQNNRALRSNPNALAAGQRKQSFMLCTYSSQNNRALRSNPNIYTDSRGYMKTGAIVTK